MKIGISNCLLGTNCNFNGKDLLSPFVKALSLVDGIEVVSFCPEDAVFGTPRANLRIVGGDGNDVLDGRAVVIDENGVDVTAKQISGAQQFLARLTSQNIQVAILMDGSPSCGSHVLLKEDNWPAGGFKRGVGVAAALLMRNQIKVFSSFDELLMSEFSNSRLPTYQQPEGLKNLKDFPKFKALFEE